MRIERIDMITCMQISLPSESLTTKNIWLMIYAERGL